MKTNHRLLAAALAALICSSGIAQDIKIGFLGNFTGPTANIGLNYKRAAELYPRTLGGRPVKWIILDDAGDSVEAVKIARRLVEEEKVDAILGSASPPAAQAVSVVAAESRTLQMALAPIPITPDKKPWVFNVAASTELMVGALVDDMKKKGIRNVAFIGFGDVFGDNNLAALRALAPAANLTLVAEERYRRTDTTVTSQALKVVASKPDAVFVGASGTPAVLPHTALRDAGYTGPIYNTNAVLSPAFIQFGGKAVEGALISSGKLTVFSELDNADPVKAQASKFVTLMEEKHGKGAANGFAGLAWDAMLLLDGAATEANKKAKPGTPEYRVALRDALENGTPVTGVGAVFRYTRDDHFGLDKSSTLLVTVKDGAFRAVDKPSAR